MGRIKGMTKTTRYPIELRGRAAATACELEREPGGHRGAIARTAEYLDLNPETVRNWVRSDEWGKKLSGQLASGPAAECSTPRSAIPTDSPRPESPDLSAASVIHTIPLSPYASTR